MGARPGIQVMSATPTGIMCTMTPEVWNQLYGSSMVTVQQPGVPQTMPTTFPAIHPAQQPQQQMLGGAFAQYRKQRAVLSTVGMESASGIGPAMPKGSRARLPQPPMSPRRFFGVGSADRSSWAESGIFLNEIRALYDLSNYPYDSAVTFFIYTYVEVNGVRRLIRVRSIPDTEN